MNCENGCIAHPRELALDGEDLVRRAVRAIDHLAAQIAHFLLAECAHVHVAAQLRPAHTRDDTLDELAVCLLNRRELRQVHILRVPERQERGHVELQSTRDIGALYIEFAFASPQPHGRREPDRKSVV